MLDPTVTIGNLVEISTIIAGGTITFALLRATVIHLREEVAEMKIDIKALNKIIIEMAVADQRLLRVEADLRELRHGRGFVREALQGEWPKNGTS